MVKILSYNIWFSRELRAERLESLVATIQNYMPDIICLQEVVPESLAVLKSTMKEYKYCFPESLEYAYGSVIMSKLPMKAQYEHDFPNSVMGRKLQVCRFNINDKMLVVANTHFESEFKKENAEKVSQMKQTEFILLNEQEEFGSVVFCADTNITDSDEASFFTNGIWSDCWKEKGNKKEEWTYDYYANENLNGKNIGRYQSRLDRMLYISDNIKCTDYKLIKGIAGLVQPSDHFGILGEFDI